jgi:hypothetical protein
MQLPGRSSVISVELQAGGNSLCLYLTECSFDLTEGHPGQLVYTFVIDVLSTSHSYISTFQHFCCYSIGIYNISVTEPVDRPGVQIPQHPAGAEGFGASQSGI